MNRKHYLKIILAVALAFGVTVVGCDNGSGAGESDTWSDVTSLDQLDGYWKSPAKTSSETITIQNYMEQQSMAWTSGMATTYGKITVTVKTAKSSSIYFNVNNMEWALITSSVDSETYIFSGGNLSNPGVWPSFLEVIGYTELDEGVNNTQHSITGNYNYPLPSVELTDEMLSMGIQINQNSHKIKLPAGFNGSDLPELIMIKQW